MTLHRYLIDLGPTLLTAGLILFALVSTLVAETLAGNPEILDGDTVHFVRLGERVALKAWMLPKRGNTALTRRAIGITAANRLRKP